MKLTREERETVILWSQADRVATVSSLDPKVQRRMLRSFGKPGEERGSWMRWTVPLSSVLPRRIGAKKGSGGQFGRS